MTYLGFILDRDGLRPDPERAAPILKYPMPLNIRELRKFLGIMTWYARFIKNYADLKLPLNKLLYKGQKWEWGHEQEASFVGLKE